jgi:tetratricopeptide (TPR) repeat protein
MWGWLKGDRKKTEEQVVQPVARSGAEYLRLLNDLLDRLAVEPGYATLMAWSIMHRVREGELAAWLRGATEQLDESLRGRLELLVSLRRGDLSVVAEEVLGAAKTTIQDFSSDDAEGWFDRGNSLAMEGRFEEAIKSFDRAISFKNDFYKAWNNRGILLCDGIGRYEEAIESYDRAISFNHDFHRAWSNRGTALSILGHDEEAIKSYDRAISVQPDFYEAWYQRGFSLADLGRYDEAIKSYDQAISVQPDFYEAWYQRGFSLANLGRYEEAIESYDQAISFKPDKHEAWHQRGVSLANLGRYEEAINAFDCATSNQPNCYVTWLNRGSILADLDRDEEAIKSFDCAISIQPDCHDTWYRKGNSLADLNRDEEAINAFDCAASIQPDFYAVWLNRGSILANLGRYEEAIKSFDHATSIQSDCHDAWNNRGLALNHLDRHEEALKSYERAVSIRPDFHTAWSSRGSTLSNLGRYEEAIENYQQGLSHLQPTTHPEGWGKLYQGLGQLHYRKGQNNFDKFRLDSRVYYRQAFTAFQAAETTLIRFPELHLGLIQDFMKVYSALREPEKANSCREQGRELLKQLLNNQPPQQRRKLLAKFNSFRQLEVDILLQQHQPNQALEAAELCKNLCLESLLSALQENIVSPSFAQIQTLLQPHSAIIYWHLSPSALSTFILQPGDNEPTVFYSYDLAELQAWIAQWDKINTVATTPSAANAKKKTIDLPLAPAFATLDWPKLQQILEISKITQHLQQTPGITNLTLIPHKDLHRLPLHQFFTQPVTYLPSLQIALNLRQKAPTDPALIVDLIQPPQGSELSNAEVEIVTIKALFPKGRLLPSSNTTKPEFLEFIGAVGRGNTRKDPHPSPLPRRERGQETSLDNPSFLLGTAQKQENSLDVADSLPSTPAPLLPTWEKGPGVALSGSKGDEGKPSSPLTSSPPTIPRRILHFTGHSQHFARRPQESCLYLNNNETITCPDLATSNLTPYHIVILSACQTSIANHQSLHDEYIGLVSACLSGGASYTISALWNVKDQASSPLFIYFYQQLAQNIPAPQALHNASQWLRHITNNELSQFYAQLQQHPKLSHQDEVLEKISAIILHLQTLKAIDRPYQDPYYWAAFTISGTT